MYKNQVISLNNIPKWYRFHQSKIKNEYKDMLKEWYIPTPKKEYTSLYIEFHLFRHNKRVLDSDNLGFIIKWTLDSIKETENIEKKIKWLTDDDQIQYMVVPAILNRDLKDTSITVKVFER
jgi:hypothetical protein